MTAGLDGDDTTGVVVAVAQALAHADKQSTVDLGYTLHEHVDTDALRALAARPDTTWELTFEVPDHEVTVTSDGIISVDGVRFETRALTSDGAP
mgnify:CR=1 FL=1